MEIAYKEGYSDSNRPSWEDFIDEWYKEYKKHTASKKSKKRTASMEDDILTSYLETALWSSTDDDDTPLDDLASINDFSEESMKESKKDIKKFLTMAKEKLGTVILNKMDSGSLGHNFWLTRNGHGAGFWGDNDYTEEVGKVLTEISDELGNVDIYIGDDGEVHII
jgi:hypothetical protein